MKSTHNSFILFCVAIAYLSALTDSLRINHQAKIKITDLHNLKNFNHKQSDQAIEPEAIDAVPVSDIEIEAFNAIPVVDNQDLKDPFVRFGIWVAFDPVLSIRS